MRRPELNSSRARRAERKDLFSHFVWRSREGETAQQIVGDVTRGPVKIVSCCCLIDVRQQVWINRHCMIEFRDHWKVQCRLAPGELARGCAIAIHDGDSANGDPDLLWVAARSLRRRFHVASNLRDHVRVGRAANFYLGYLSYTGMDRFRAPRSKQKRNVGARNVPAQGVATRQFEYFPDIRFSRAAQQVAHALERLTEGSH